MTTNDNTAAPAAQPDPALPERLREGARWARGEGRPNLARLLEAVCEELLALRAEVSQSSVCCLEELGVDSGMLQSELHELSSTLRKVECRLADVEVTLDGLGDDVRDVKNEVDALAEETE